MNACDHVLPPSSENRDVDAERHCITSVYFVFNDHVNPVPIHFPDGRTFTVRLPFALNVTHTCPDAPGYPSTWLMSTCERPADVILISIACQYWLVAFGVCGLGVSYSAAAEIEYTVFASLITPELPDEMTVLDPWNVGVPVLPITQCTCSPLASLMIACPFAQLLKSSTIYETNTVDDCLLVDALMSCIHKVTMYVPGVLYTCAPFSVVQLVELLASPKFH